jgi:hypothetical protein
LESAKCFNLKDLVVHNYDPTGTKNDYVEEGQILERVLTIFDIRRLEFEGNMKYMISGLVKAGSGTIFARLESLIFARCFFDGLWIRIQWSCDFVSRCPNLRFLIVDFDKISDNFKVIKAAVHNCSELSEL